VAIVRRRVRHSDAEDRGKDDGRVTKNKPEDEPEEDGV
jgi:hypothetical protein